MSIAKKLLFSSTTTLLVFSTVPITGVPNKWFWGFMKVAPVRCCLCFCVSRDNFLFFFCLDNAILQRDPICFSNITNTWFLWNAQAGLWCNWTETVWYLKSPIRVAAEELRKWECTVHRCKQQLNSKFLAVWACINHLLERWGFSYLVGIVYDSLLPERNFPCLCPRTWWEYTKINANIHWKKTMKTEPWGQMCWFIPVIPALSRHRLGDYKSRLAWAT